MEQRGIGRRGLERGRRARQPYARWIALATGLGALAALLPGGASGCDISTSSDLTIGSNTGCRYQWSGGNLTVATPIDASNAANVSEAALIHTTASIPSSTLTIQDGASITADRSSAPTINVAVKVSSPSHTLGEIANHGSVTGSEISIWLNSGHLGTLNNYGTLSGYIKTGGFTNFGTLNMHEGSTLSGSSTALSNAGLISSVTNRGTISSDGYSITNSGYIAELLNYGSITGASGGIRNSGPLVRLVNQQAGLTLIGRAPGSYYTLIHGQSAGQYGTLIVSTADSQPWSISGMTYGIAEGSTVRTGVTYQNVIQAASGATFDGTETKTGTFDSNGLLFDFELVHDGTHWDLVMAGVDPGGSLTQAAREHVNPAALQAARVIDDHEELAAVFGELEEDELSAAASQTLPLLTSGGSFAAQSAMTGIHRIVQARIEGNRGISAGEEFYGDDRLWLKPFGSWASQGSRSRVAGFDVHSYGLAIGLDGAPSSRLRLGGALAYARTNVDGGARAAAQDADIAVYQLIGYGTYSLSEGTDLSFQLDVGRNVTEGERQLSFASTTAESDYASHTVHVGLGIGRTRALGAQTTVTPQLRFDWSRIDDESYRESGAGLFNLDVDRRGTGSLILGFDTRFAYRPTERTTLLATLGLGFDTVNDRASSVASFAGAPDAAFHTPGIDPNPWLSRGGLSLVHENENGFQITARYDAEGRTSFLNQTLSLKLRWPF